MIINTDTNTNLSEIKSNSINSIEDIKHIFYINLKFRPEKKISVENQLNTIGIKNPQRFNAIYNKNGALGCSFSHLKIMENAKKNQLPHVLIVEDDIFFTNPELFKEQFNKFLSRHKRFDVLLLAGNNLPPYGRIDDSCIKVTKCQTTTGYLVLEHYYDTLIENYKKGILYLLNEPEKHIKYAIDKYWFNLQEIHNWFLIIPLTVTQLSGYSDIEKKVVNYNKAMLDIDKIEWMQRQHAWKNAQQKMKLI